MNTVTVTTTSRAAAPPPPLLNLRLSDTLDERQADLIRALQNSPLFIPEERDALEQATRRLREEPTYTLAYLQVHLIRAAIIRYGERVQAPLFQYEEELMAILQARLPEGVDAEDFVKCFEERAAELETMYAMISGVQERFASIREGLYATADALNDRIDQVARDVIAVSSDLQRVYESSRGLEERVGDVSQRMQQHRVHLEQVIEKGHAALRREAR